MRAISAARYDSATVKNDIEGNKSIVEISRRTLADRVVGMQVALKAVPKRARRGTFSALAQSLAA